MTWAKVRHELLSAWWFARLRPVRSALVVLGVTAIAGAVVNGLATLFSEPFSAPSTALSSLLWLGLVGTVVWGLAWAFSAAVGALIRLGFAVLIPRGLRARVGGFVAGAGALLGAIVAWLFMVALADWSLVTALLAAALVAGLFYATQEHRQHAAALRWLVGHLVGAARTFDPESGEWSITDDEWTGDHLVKATAHYPADVRVSEPQRRAGIQRAVMWAMRHDPHIYTLRWSATARAVDIVAEPPLPDRLNDGTWPRMAAGIPLAVCAVSQADVVVVDEHGEQRGLRCWNPNDERDMLVCGVKGSGKTVFCRRLIVHGLATDWFPGGVFVIDGKSGDDYIPLEGRAGIQVVAVLPPQWLATLEHLVSIVEERYAAKRDYAAGRTTTKPVLLRILVMIDEIQNVMAALPEAEDLIEALARMARAAGVSMVVATQRPDTKGAVPGPIRDQLEDRVACGWMSPDGGRMVLDADWQLVVDDDDSTGETATIAKPRGRAVMRIGGRLSRTQIPWLDSPVDAPQWEPLYPPREAPAGPPPPEPRRADHDTATRVTPPQSGDGGAAPRRRPRRTD